VAALTILGGLGLAFRDVSNLQPWEREADVPEFETTLQALASAQTPLVLVLNDMDAGRASSERVLARLDEGALGRLRNVLVVAVTADALHFRSEDLPDADSHTRIHLKLARLATRKHNVPPFAPEELATMTGISVNLASAMLAIGAKNPSLVRNLRGAMAKSAIRIDQSSEAQDVLLSVLRSALDDAVHRSATATGTDPEALKEGLLAIALQGSRFSKGLLQEAVGPDVIADVSQAAPALAANSLLLEWPTDEGEIAESPMDREISDLLVSWLPRAATARLVEKTLLSAQILWEHDERALPWLSYLARTAGRMDVAEQYELRLHQTVGIRTETELMLSAGTPMENSLTSAVANLKAVENFALIRELFGRVDVTASAGAISNTLALAERGENWRIVVALELRVANIAAAIHRGSMSHPRDEIDDADDGFDQIAVGAISRAMAISAERQYPDLYTQSVSMAALVYAFLGDKQSHQEFVEWFAESVPKAPSQQDIEVVAASAIVIASDDYEEAKTRASEVAILSDSSLNAMVLDVLAVGAFREGRLEEAKAWAQQVLDVWPLPPTNRGRALEILATVLLGSEDATEVAEGKALLLEAIDLARLMSQGKLFRRLVALAESVGITVPLTLGLGDKMWWQESS
jgi:hypothetical protein